MQVDNFEEKKKDLDAHVEFIKGQILLVEDEKEKTRLLSVLDELLSEKVQLDDYVTQRPKLAFQGMRKAKLQNMEKEKLVRLCSTQGCTEIGTRWCLYHGRNKEGQHVLSEADWRIKRIDASFSEEDFFYLDKSEFWQRKTPIPDEIEEN
nr:hypothetical protein Cplu_463 [Cedratvirus plubellavi]